MQVLQRSETFQKRFNLPQVPTSRPPPRKRKRSGWASLLWWSSLLTVSAIPGYTVVATDLVSAWNKIDAAVKSTLDFPRTHRIRVPNAAHTDGVSFADTNADLIAWHRDMSRLQLYIAEDTPIGTVQDSTLEFVFQKPPAKSATREWRAAAVSMYFLLAASLYFVDSVHIAVILLQLNMLEFSLAIKIKQLDDALEKTVDHLSAMHMELAMLPLEDDFEAIAHQVLCLQKMELFHNVWAQVNLGQNMRIPFRSDFVSLNLSLVFSIVAAVLLRCVEVLLLSVWPNLSRFNLSKQVYHWVRRSLPGSSMQQAQKEQPGDASLYDAPADLRAEPSQPTSLDLMFRQQSAEEPQELPQSSRKNLAQPVLSLHTEQTQTVFGGATVEQVSEGAALLDAVAEGGAEGAPAQQMRANAPDLTKTGPASASSAAQRSKYT